MRIPTETPEGVVGLRKLKRRGEKNGDGHHQHSGLR